VCGALSTSFCVVLGLFLFEFLTSSHHRSLAMESRRPHGSFPLATTCVLST
jgi:hypothetical protein